MGVLDITENTKLLTVGAVYDIIVCVDDYQYDLEMYMQHPEIGYRDMQKALREEISELEDIGENLSNIRTLVQKITKNHDQLRILTSFDSDMNGNTSTLRLTVMTPSRQSFMISVILRKKKLG